MQRQKSIVYNSRRISMSDLYTELLVKRTTPFGDQVLKFGMIFLTVLAGVAGIYVSPYLLIAFAALAILDYFKLSSFDLEFEYLYVNGELDIDKIMSRTKRKRIANYNMANVELIAPYTSHELDHYRQDKNIKMQNFSSREKDAKVYAMIVSNTNNREMVLFEPNDVMLNDMKRIAPRKVKLS